MPTPESQAVYINRILRGTASRSDIAVADAGFQQWVREEWGGDAQRAAAACIGALARACGSEWDALPEAYRTAHLWLFGLTCPPPFDMDAAAGGYRDGIGPGRLRSFAAKLRGE
jgi:hypothetical protein